LIGVLMVKFTLCDMIRLLLFTKDGMGVFTMSYIEMNAESLASYKRREERREQVSQQVGQTLVQLSLNLHFHDKLPTSANGLFVWGLRQMLEVLPQVDSCAHGFDRLGPWALLGAATSAETLKQQAVALENDQPAGVLLDIDVYDQQGLKLERQALNLPLRRCLVCQQPLVECLHNSTHSSAELKARSKRLLAPFRT
jgi:holo-ACP synthase